MLLVYATDFRYDTKFKYLSIDISDCGSRFQRDVFQHGAFPAAVGGGGSNRTEVGWVPIGNAAQLAGYAVPLTRRRCPPKLGYPDPHLASLPPYGYAAPLLILVYIIRQRVCRIFSINLGDFHFSYLEDSFLDAIALSYTSHTSLAHVSVCWPSSVLENYQFIRNEQHTNMSLYEWTKCLNVCCMKVMERRLTKRFYLLCSSGRMLVRASLLLWGLYAPAAPAEISLTGTPASSHLNP